MAAVQNSAIATNGVLMSEHSKMSWDPLRGPPHHENHVDGSLHPLPRTLVSGTEAS
jgi:hypothetical protein